MAAAASSHLRPFDFSTESSSNEDEEFEDCLDCSDDDPDAGLIDSDAEELDPKKISPAEASEYLFEFLEGCFLCGELSARTVAIICLFRACR